MLDLRWNAQTVARIAAENGIKTREDLARRLVPEISRMTVYRAFTENWQGRVTSIPLFVAMADTFSVSVADLVVDPISARQNRQPTTIDRGTE